MPQYQAMKDLRHDGKVVYAGSVVPTAWVEEWDGYGNNTVAKMRRNNQLQLLPGDQELEEAVPVDLNVGASLSASMTSNERAAVHELLDKMSEREALDYVRENDLVKDPGAPTGVDPDAVVVADAWANDDSEISEDEIEFDPSEHSVADVKAFVEENPETASDILDAETSNRNRSTLTKWLEDFIEGQPEDTEPDSGGFTVDDEEDEEPQP